LKRHVSIHPHSPGRFYTPRPPPNEIHAPSRCHPPAGPLYPCGDDAVTVRRFGENPLFRPGSATREPAFPCPPRIGDPFGARSRFQAAHCQPQRPGRTAHPGTGSTRQETPLPACRIQSGPRSRPEDGFPVDRGARRGRGRAAADRVPEARDRRCARTAGMHRASHPRDVMNGASSAQPVERDELVPYVEEMPVAGAGLAQDHVEQKGE